MLLGAVAELITIGAVLPFLAFAANSESDLGGPAVRDLLDIVHHDPLVAASIMLILAAVCSALVRFLLLWVNQKFVTAFGQELAATVFSRMIRQSYSDYLRHNTSEVLSGITKVQDVVYGYVQPLMQTAISMFSAICIVVFLLVIDPVATTVGGILIILTYFAIGIATAPRVRSNAWTIAEAMTLRTKLLQESLGGIRDIILERSYHLFEDKFREMDSAYRQAVASNNIVASSPRFLIEATGISAIVAITFMMSRQSGGLTEAIPVLGALALGAQRLLPLAQASWNGIKLAAGHSRILADVALLANQPVPEDVVRPLSVDPLMFQKSLVFDAVSFRYDDDRFAVRDLSFEIFRGEYLGIAGETGSGKSTMLDLILGLLEPDRGEIRLDGNALDARVRKALQGAIAHVPQSVFLADDTISANITFGSAAEEIDKQRLQEAINLAQLSPFLAKLPDGTNTLVGERGIRLSGGQRQRIGIARALYSKPSILVLDEATSALDGATETAVMKAVTSAYGDLTTISVAHRISTLAHCDRVLTLKDGMIVSISGEG